MRSVITSIGLLMASGIVGGQNLVNNGGFEEYTDCPDMLNQMDRATGWSRYRNSPDYFNRCDTTSGYAGVPMNRFGWQEPATGDAYAGAVIWQDFPSNTREHFGAMLIEPLQPGVPVYISYKVSPATGGVLDAGWTVEGMGLRFSMIDYVEGNDPLPLPNYAVLHMTSPPMDTSSWYQISGAYVPDSAYQYVVLGNFFADTMVTPVVLNPVGTLPTAYVYVDDVCVSHTAEECGVDVGIMEGLSTVRLQAYPVPFMNRFTLRMNGGGAEVMSMELSNAMGQPVWRGMLPPGQRSIEVFVPHLPVGMYVLRAVSPMGRGSAIVLIHVEP